MNHSMAMTIMCSNSVAVKVLQEFELGIYFLTRVHDYLYLSAYIIVVTSQVLYV